LGVGWCASNTRHEPDAKRVGENMHCASANSILDHCSSLNACLKGKSRQKEQPKQYEPTFHVNLVCRSKKVLQIP